MKRLLPSPRPAVRGAAKVAVTWLIVFAVLFVAALFFGYIAYDSEAKAKASLQDAVSAKAEAEERADAESKALSELSRAVGFYDPSMATPRTDVAQLKAAVEEIKASFPDMKDDIKSIADVLPRAITSYAARGKEISTLNSAKESALSDLKTKDTSLGEALRQKDQEIANLQKQVQDAEANATQKQKELEDRITQLNNQRNQLDSDLRGAQAAAAQQARKLEDEIATLQTRISSLNASLKFLAEPEASDGAVLAVSKDLDLGWINRGTYNRLAVGTVFRVVSGKAGSSRVKAFATVTRVDTDRAEVRFSDVTDRFDPPVPGDQVYNPLYDPTGERNAVLAGRFSGTYNEGDIKGLLEKMGIHVQQQVGLDTDYLIVGSELYTDPTTGETLEQALPVSELPEYKEAEAKGVLIIPIKDLRSYFKKA